jgi:hypothetical protein
LKGAEAAYFIRKNACQHKTSGKEGETYTPIHRNNQSVAEKHLKDSSNLS